MAKAKLLDETNDVKTALGKVIEFRSVFLWMLIFPTGSPTFLRYYPLNDQGIT
jgi:hypothetical protein